MADETADLRMAIVRQAAADYIRAKKLLKIQPDNHLAQRTVREVRKFIKGKWYATICDINPDFLLRALDEKGGTHELDDDHHFRPTPPTP